MFLSVLEQIRLYKSTMLQDSLSILPTARKMLASMMKLPSWSRVVTYFLVLSSTELDTGVGVVVQLNEVTPADHLLPFWAYPCFLFLIVLILLLLVVLITLFVFIFTPFNEGETLIPSQ